MTGTLADARAHCHVRAHLDRHAVQTSGLARGVGCDCLGLVRGVWREVIGDEPEAPSAYAPDWAEATGTEALAEAALRHLVPIQIAKAAPGDVLLLRWRETFVAKHAVLMTTPTTFVHAHDGAAVCEVALSPWWRRRIAFAFRFPGVN